MPTPNPPVKFPFSGGSVGIPPYGQKDNLIFGGTWLQGETYQIEGVTSLSENFTLGRGNLANVNSAVSLLTFNKRMYIAMAQQFNGSDNVDPVHYEEQYSGAILVPFLSQYGQQDGVFVMSTVQGRLAVFGRRSIQIWTVDADPGNFALTQVLDNIGTIVPLSVQQLGDFDVLFYDDTGVRSLRSREVTLNAYVDDIGSQIDDLIKADVIAAGGTAGMCAIVEPATKNYWIYVNGKIYVLSRHPGSKISAWSFYLPTDDEGNPFTPQKFVVFNGQVFIRGVERGFYTYGGSDNQTYDDATVVTVQTPWLYDKRPATMKQAAAINAVLAGEWTLSLSMDPQSNNFTQVMPDRGNASNPSALTDSTYDILNFRTPGLQGTHFSILAVSNPANSVNAKQPMTLSSLVFHYNEAGKA